MKPTSVFQGAEIIYCFQESPTGVLDMNSSAAAFLVVGLVGAGMWAANGDRELSLPQDRVVAGEAYNYFDNRRDQASLESFAGHGCIDDCSGHDAGYRWADERGIEDAGDCGGKSWSFIEGCEAFVEDSGGSSATSRGARFTTDGSIFPGPEGGMVIGGKLDGSILPGREGGMVIGGRLDGSILPGEEGGMVIGGPLDGSIMPDFDGGMIIGGPLDGEIVAGE